MENAELWSRIEKEVRGAYVSKVSAGGSAGSIFGMYFSPTGDSSWSWYLAVECTWRLWWDNVLLTGSRDDVGTSGALVTGLNSLTNKQVMGLNISEPAYDLQIAFDGNLELEVFCDVLHHGNCWYFLNPEEKEFSIEPAGKIILN